MIEMRNNIIDKRDAGSTISKMLNIRQVREALGLSYKNIIDLVNRGELRCFRYIGKGGPVERGTVDRNTTGLRFKESDIAAFLDEYQIK